MRGDWCVPFASLNHDDDFGRQLAREIRERGGEVRTYGFGEEADYRVVESVSTLRGAELAVATPDGEVRLETRLPGRHNAANLAAALVFADHLQLPRETALATLSAAAPVPGRFELVEVKGPFDVIVDFGYTPGSVGAALGAARDLAHERGGRLLVVFSLLGRAAVAIGHEVGACARELSDHLILSASSYVGEPRVKNLAQVLAGARSVPGGTLEIVLDRREAIARALSQAEPGDLVMVQGRGATPREATDRRGGFRDLDDRQIIRELDTL